MSEEPRNTKTYYEKKDWAAIGIIFMVLFVALLVFYNTAITYSNSNIVWKIISIFASSVIIIATLRYLYGIVIKA
jgi:uncharacterized protein (DUF983 family)